MPKLTDATLILPPQFLADTNYYAAIWAAKKVVIDLTMPFNKRFKSTHRTIIADANGTTMLTIPIEKPASRTEAKWSDIVVSSHGEWWHVVMTALRSAYGRTPFCEYYIDDFERLINHSAAGRPLMELCKSLDTLMRRLLQIDTPVSYYTGFENKFTNDETVDFRYRLPESIRPTEYYQVRSTRHGFIPGLSAVDLLFNMGTESPLVLDRIADLLKH